MNNQCDVYIDGNRMMIDSYELAREIFNSNFIPTKLIAIWRGGAIPSLCIHEFFNKKGFNVKDTVVKLESYDINTREQKRELKLRYTANLDNDITIDDKILIVDDIFDTGKTIEEVLYYLESKMNINLENVRVATLWVKPENIKVGFYPDYVLHKAEKDHWLVFPHEQEW